jgi:hypothetical protein
MQHLTKEILTTKITKATKGSDILIINFVLFVLLSLKVFAACANFPVVRGYQNGDLLAPRRQERQVRKFNFFAAFAPLREIIRVLVAARPR